MKYILVVFVTAFCSLFANLSKAQTAAVDNKLSQKARVFLVFFREDRPALK
jgi:hypothetical protein